MTEEKVTADQTTEQKAAETAVYTKAQVLASKKYSDESDLVNAVLDEAKTYSLAEVNTLIENYKFKEVG